MPRFDRFAASPPGATLLPALLLALALASPAPPAAAKTFTFPHILDAKGPTNTTPYSYDTIIYMVYGDRPGATGLGATADLYLYDNFGQPMKSQTATDVCNPCSYPLGGGNPRKVSLSVEDLIVAAGDFQGVKLGFGVIVVGGSDPDAVAVQGFVVNSHTSAFDLSTAPMEPNEVGGGGGGGGGSTRRTFVLPHVLEREGRISNTQYTFDTTIYATYTAGLAGLPAGAGATANLYLLDEAGSFLVGGGGAAVCGPCSFTLDGITRKQSISLETLIETAGGFGGSPVMTGYALLDVEGDVSAVGALSFVVNSHTSAFDVSVFGWSPQEITAPGRVAVGPGQAAAARLDLAVSPNPSRTGSTGSGGATLSFELPAAAAIELAVYDVNGREVARLASGLHAAGAHRMSWDGRDASGAAVSPGVYFARLTDGSGSATSRIVAIH